MQERRVRSSEPVQHAASEITAPDTDHLPAYWQFHDAVTRAQLMAWLPPGRHILVDVSGPRAPGAELAAQAGHTVLRVIDSARPGDRWSLRDREDLRDGRDRGDQADLKGRTDRGDQADLRGRADLGSREATGAKGPPRGVWGDGSPQDRGGLGGSPPRLAEHPRIISLIADCSGLPFLGDGCADGVIADDRALSMHLAAETMIAEIARVLRPSGRVLACVDSLVLGMAVLADQHHWAQLVDLPHAEVVLVPWPDGTITRCYGPDQARELFSGAGLTVNWIRPRTVFSESMVTHLLRRAPDSLPQLVRAELAAQSDESLGAQLVISASKPADGTAGRRTA